MPIFEYKGLTKDGKSVKGNLDSENLRTARIKLKKDGVFVVDIKDRKKSAARKSNSKPSGSVNVKELSLMTRQLATLIKANIPLVDALTAISEQVENKVLAEAIADCKDWPSFTMFWVTPCGCCETTRDRRLDALHA